MSCRRTGLTSPWPVARGPWTGPSTGEAGRRWFSVASSVAGPNLVPATAKAISISTEKHGSHGTLSLDDRIRNSYLLCTVPTRRRRQRHFYNIVRHLHLLWIPYCVWIAYLRPSVADSLTSLVISQCGSNPHPKSTFAESRGCNPLPWTLSGWGMKSGSRSPRRSSLRPSPVSTRTRYSAFHRTRAGHARSSH